MPAHLDAAELHHGSHRRLLRDEKLPWGKPFARLDAIMVPTVRPVDSLRHVMQVGRLIDCPVVVFCSGSASAASAHQMAEELGAAVLAIDVHRPLASTLPRFATDQLLRANGFGSDSDLSLKRNLGLALARGSSWRRVLFLDDDIAVEDPMQLHHAAGLVDHYRAVGLENHGFEDNSVVCHAYRQAHGKQESFIGGGAMIVDASQTTSFNPNIYNEDWFFLLGDGTPILVARAGAMSQRIFDPFADPERARREELGDTLAEGLF
ncbi:hypothetical protein ACQP2E_10435 [Actinoplanes sp. CA-015351]|uniref:hypothetical protein n=1 Tax=Actinoplanes sp. CA-015351 TaxID=3239897 RepID=UPI003D981787